MSDLIISKVEEWYAANGQRFSKLFTIFNFRLMLVSDPVRGKTTIEIDGSSAGANITFWNKGEVAALLLNKVSGKEYILDDRRLTPADQVGSLLDSYMQRVIEESKASK